MEVSDTTVILSVVLVSLILLVIAGCKLSCSKQTQKSGYMRTCLANPCQFVRTPVDYYSDYSKDPHYIADTLNKYKPLDTGVDLYREERKLDDQRILWKQYGPNWMGCGIGRVFTPNDTKTRALLTETGEIQLREKLDSQWSKRFGPDGPLDDDARYNRPDPYKDDQPLYGDGLVPHVIGS